MKTASALTLLSAFALAQGVDTPIAAPPAGVVIEPVPGGYINWTEGRLVLSTTAVSNTGAWKDVKAIEQSAFQQLEPRVEETCASVRFTADTNAGDLLSESGALAESLQDALAEWRVTETRYYASGRVELRAELGLHGWLRAALVSQADAPSAGERPTPKVTGLVVDARGLAVQPAMAPRLLAPDGETLYGPQSLSPETAAQRAPAVWSLDPSRPEVTQRAGAAPIFLRVASVRGGADLVLDRDDASRLRALVVNSDLLASAPVAVVVDP